jgi:deoxyribonuclease V
MASFKVRVKIPPGFSVEKARRAQKALALKVKLEGVKPSQVRLVGGVDLSYPSPNRARAAAVLLDAESLKLVEAESVEAEVRFPYVPTLLSFREAPPIFKVLTRLKKRPDVVLVDGQGLAHPFKCGLACHIGVVLGIPTIGVAKGLLCGEVESFKDGRAPIVLEGETVGMAVSTGKGKPIYVSVGHLVSLEDAVEIVLKCVRKFSRLPEPLRLAHRLAASGRV